MGRKRLKWPLFVRPDSDKIYCWVPQPEGRSRKVCTGFTDEESARARATELHRQASDPDRAAAAKATLRDALALMIRQVQGDVKAGKKSAATVDFYRKKAGVILDALAEVLKRSPKAIIYLRECTAALVDDYIALRREEAEDSTIHKELTAWRKALRIAKRRGLFAPDLDAVFPVGFSPAYKPRDRFVSPEELLALYRAMVRPIPIRQPKLEVGKLAEMRARRALGEPAPALAAAFGVSVPTVHRLTSTKRVDPTPGPAVGHELFAIVCYSIATSAEWSAIWRAREGDVAADLGLVHVRGSKNANRDRVVPVQLLAFGFLLDYAVRHGDGGDDGQGGRFLFRGSHASSFRHRLAEACERAGIPHLSPNDLRRTHAKWLRLAGVAPSNISPSMGHIDDRMVQRVYGQSSAEELAGVQAAQIAAGPGILLGAARGDQASQAAAGEAPEPPDTRLLLCPDPESNQGHGDFQSPPGGRLPTAHLAGSVESREPIGRITSPPGTATPDVVPSRVDEQIPAPQTPTVLQSDLACDGQSGQEPSSSTKRGVDVSSAIGETRFHTDGVAMEGDAATEDRASATEPGARGVDGERAIGLAPTTSALRKRGNTVAHGGASAGDAAEDRERATQDSAPREDSGSGSADAVGAGTTNALEAGFASLEGKGSALEREEALVAAMDRELELAVVGDRDLKPENLRGPAKAADRRSSGAKRKAAT